MDTENYLDGEWRPVAPAAPEAFPFDNAIVIAYWREEILRGCAASLERLREICRERHADFEKTVEGLR